MLVLIVNVVNVSVSVHVGLRHLRIKTLTAFGCGSTGKYQVRTQAYAPAYTRACCAYEQCDVQYKHCTYRSYCVLCVSTSVRKCALFCFNELEKENCGKIQGFYKKTLKRTYPCLLGRGLGY